MAMTHSERLERETERTRAEVEHTLAELRGRMSPGQIAERATDYLRGSDGRALVHNLRRQVVENPLPAALIGAGIAWLAISTTIGRRNGHGHHDERIDDAGARYHPDDYQSERHGMHDPTRSDLGRSDFGGNDRWDDAKHAVSDLGERASDTAEDLVDRARDTAASWTEDARDAAADAGERVRDTAEAVSDRATHAYDETRRGVRRVVRRVSEYGKAARRAVEPDGTFASVAREQPMLVAGIGLAIGAALGALLPGTRAESRVMGEASRTLRSQAAGLAEEVAGPRDDGDAAQRPGRDWDNERGPTVKSGDTGVESGTVRAHPKGSSTEPESQPRSTAPYAESAEVERT